MNETRIKVCGITCLEDARKCFSLGVDYLGVIFADSPRKVSMETVRMIRTALPRARLVGVFVDAPLEFVARVVEHCGLDLVQLHGSETPAYCEKLFEAASIPIIKAVSPGSESRIGALGEYGEAHYFLFDLDKANAYPFRSSEERAGSLDMLWQAAAQASAEGYRVFLAGGLDASNVRSCMSTVDPFCIDVCRGVERQPGIKDEDLLERFIAEVRT
jgi:phosphoribosylanthranilate isomerase